MSLCTFKEAAELLGYRSRSTLYKLKKDGWLDDYLVNVYGIDHLEMKPVGKPKLDKYIMSIIQWRPSNPIREIAKY